MRAVRGLFNGLMVKNCRGYAKIKVKDICLQFKIIIINSWSAAAKEM